MAKSNSSGTLIDYAALAARAPQIFLGLAAFLAPLIGGAVAIDAGTLEPGYAPTMRAIFGGTDAPILSHFVLALLASLSTLWILASRRVIQVPMVWIFVPTLAFFGVIAASTLFSAHLFVSVPATFEWLAYSLAFVGAVAALGRRRGPHALLACLFAGSTILAMLGLWEYFFRTEDPTWRIFGTWQNPNALAGMLLIGFFVGCGLCLKGGKLEAILAAIFGTSAIAIALSLTQSKGAYLAAFIGLVPVFALGIAWLIGKRGVALGALLRVAVCLVILIAFLAGMRLRGSGESGTSPLSRVTAAADSQDQSSGFRRLLWTSSLGLMRDRPLGSGPGTFRYESARRGLNTQTHLAHNSFLQLGVEAGVLAPLLLLSAGVFWFGYVLKGARRQDSATLALKIGVIAAVLASAAHSMVDSDLHYFGSGFAFFLLLGIGLQLSADGGTPESVQPGPRWSAFAIALAIPLVLLYFGSLEATKGHIRWRMAKNQPVEAREGALALTQVAAGDGEGWYLLALLEPDGSRRADYLKRAADQAPNTRNLRMLARAQKGAKLYVDAASTLNRALLNDPNNLYTLKLMLDLYVAEKNDAMAEQIAGRLVKVEESPYFRIRALPELVPTETYFARLFLARRAKTTQEAADLLRVALTGMLDYATRTAPNVAAAAREGLTNYGGESVDDAREKLLIGQEIVNELAAAYRKLTFVDRAVETEAHARTFAEALRKIDEAIPPAP